MPDKLTMNYTVAIAGGPTITESASSNIEAYDFVHRTVLKGAQDFELIVQPGEEGQVKLFVVSANAYQPGLTYSVNKAQGDAAKRKALDSALVLLGEGAVDILGETPKKLFMYNDTNADVDVKVLTVRIATPAPPVAPPAGQPPAGQPPGGQPPATQPPAAQPPAVPPPGG